MKELLLQYAHYNVWANKLMIDAMTGISEAAAHRIIPSSFPTLHETMLHIWSAESIWLQRLQGAERPVWHMAIFKGSFAEGCAEWAKTSAALAAHLGEQTDESLHTVLAFRYRNGNGASLKRGDLLHHVFNHTTYHRGQLVTMLRQLGVAKIPGTDYVSFAGMMQ